MTPLKKLKVMADFCSSGIWDKDTGIMVEYEDLDITEKLCLDFKEWIFFYDNSCPPPRCTLKADHVKALNSLGRSLAVELSRQLKEVEVFFVGEDENKMLEEEKIS